ncbi:MAG: 1,4-alpha-glucan branching protein domain-containing protein [Eubacteriales bacterium]|jgi:1,4-alpha-glucan branching enzyme|nr:DUF1957 domain-containing protein [Bacillota bacterium]MBV1727668.1 DUF1957 domain-containing protein [Desulforudis sp.]MDP3051049.1 DUF1957 domain-containing protein [Eubacteriales bacterium]MDQ7788549.1 DUF1957 domain-containing protein [Clostridia bacterium]MBU4532730.1 DUF1957 domain-containing protein [Bacillota bacterium]
MTKGYLALVLHAHLPFVRHPEAPRHLEEHWYYQALTECYIPLIQSLEALYRDEVQFQLTVSLSPPLISMFTDTLMQERYLKYLERLLILADLEKRRLADQPDFRALAEMYGNRLEETRAFFRRFDSNLVGAFRGFQDRGSVELITTAATHGYLPLMRTHEARRAQIQIGVETFTRHFECLPKGFWLPECAYIPGVDALLRDNGVRYFFTETHGLTFARPHPQSGVYAPVYCPSGVAAFARDPESSRQVWDRLVGYPGDPYYREYYRDIGYELDWDYLAPYTPAEGVPTDTGFKYYRITAPNSEKQIYQPEIAEGKARSHARHFLQSRQLQAEHLSEQMDRIPLMVAPYDAELFGHWWYEGPKWIEAVCRRAAEGHESIEMTTPSRYLERYPENEVVELSLSSWGAGGYNEVWLNETNDWIYRHTHLMETRMGELADLHYGARGLVRRVLNQAAREILLAQSSDWAFIIKMGTAVEYANRRLSRHINRFNTLVDGLDQGLPHKPKLEELESQDNIFPNIDFRVYSHHYRSGSSLNRRKFRILMLSWEFPPLTVGGLGRHVYDLSSAMASQGDQVHVVTAPAPNLNQYEWVAGVRVHRFPEDRIRARDFLTWVHELNLGMIEVAESLREQGQQFDVIHAHDWLVGAAGAEISRAFGIPLVATIHATEHGRHRGLHGELQQQIHGEEKQLAHDAAALICCSKYMAREIERLFEIPAQKISVIPNGVEPISLGIRGWTGDIQTPADGGYILYIGRLVPEKGVQVLLQALALLRPQFPELKLVVAGIGPHMEELQQLSESLELNRHVTFAGFVDGSERNELFRGAAVAVFPSLYEPFGIVALEALAAQVPVIVSDTGGLGEVIEHGVDGFKIPPNRPDLMAYYLTQIITAPGVSLQMARKGWQKVLTLYDWRYISERTKDVYVRTLI